MDGSIVRLLNMFKFYFLLFCIFNSSVFAYEINSVIATSQQNELYPISQLIDQDDKTRWSSQFNDDESFIIELKEDASISGLKILWEYAFAKSYQIWVSKDHINWNKVFETQQGDGNTDYVYFDSIKTKYIKFQGIQRATSWGYSIFEVEILDRTDIPKIEYASNIQMNFSYPNKDPHLKNQSQIEILFPDRTSLGGFEFKWIQEPEKYEIKYFNHQNQWVNLDYVRSKNHHQDQILFQEIKTQKVSIQLMGFQDRYICQNINFKSKEESLNPVREYQFKAQNSVKGKYPIWLLDEQLYWTILGSDASSHELLVGEDGSLELYKEGPTLQPVIEIDKKEITAWNGRTTHQLINQYLPIPQILSHHAKFNLQQTFLPPMPEENSTLIQYQIQNNLASLLNAKLSFYLWPIQMNPSWQHGGISQISDLNIEPGSDFIKIIVNHQSEIVVPSMFNQGSIYQNQKWTDISLNERSQFTDSNGKLSLKFETSLNLSEKEIYSFLLTINHTLSEKNSNIKFEEALKQRIHVWQEKINRFQIKALTPLWDAVVKSNLAYILINKDQDAIQPGSRNYQHSWIRDGAMTCSALLKLGYQDVVYQYLNWFSDLIEDDGFIPFIVNQNEMPYWCREWKEYDSFGQYIFIMYEYFRYTHDQRLLNKYYSKIQSVLRMQKALIDQDELKILPPSNSHEGYFPAEHSYWDDFWALKGFEDGAKIALVMKDLNFKNQLEQQYQQLLQAVQQSIKKSQVKHQIQYIPGSYDLGDDDPTSIAIAFSPTHQAKILSPLSLETTFNRYFQTSVMPRINNQWKNSFTPYEIRNVNALLELNHKEEAYLLLENILSYCRPQGWNHLAEVVHQKERLPQYIGDMPHTWVGSGVINAILYFYVQEKNQTLILNQGFSLSQIKQAQQIGIENIHTPYGTVNYEIHYKDQKISIKCWGNAVPKNGFQLWIGQKLFKFDSLPYESVEYID